MLVTYLFFIKDANLEEILAEGILIRNSTVPAEMHVECAAPILRSLMIMYVSGLTPKVSIPPSITNELDVKWLLACTIEVRIMYTWVVQKVLTQDI